VLGSTPSRVLDLGCGPGLYGNRLARLGHVVRGIDFSPASIRHAQAEAEGQELEASYDLADLRAADFGHDLDVIMLVYGELNVFRQDGAAAILVRARDALRPSGHILVEPHTYAALRSSGLAAPRWQALPSGPFSERPHLLLEESFWDEPRGVTTHRWYVIDAATRAVERHADSMQAYTDAAYAALLEEAGFQSVELQPTWPAAPGQEDVLLAFTARP